MWTADTRFVMDELARWTAGDVRAAPTGSAFSGKLDISRIGVFGMSFGGTTAGQVCVVEPRCRAGVNLDGTQYGDPIDVPLRVPFMFMTSAIPGLNDPVYERATGPAYSVNVEGSTHFNYTDFSMLSPVFRRMGFLGKIDGARMERIMNHYLVAFFDTHLKTGGGESRRFSIRHPQCIQRCGFPRGRREHHHASGGVQQAVGHLDLLLVLGEGLCDANLKLQLTVHNTVPLT